MCSWLLDLVEKSNVGHPLLTKTENNMSSKIRTISAVVWTVKDNPELCEKLQAVITEEKFEYVSQIFSFEFIILLKHSFPSCMLYGLQF